MTTKEQVAKDEHSVSLTLCFMVDQDISKDDALCKTKKSVYLNLLKNKHSKVPFKYYVIKILAFWGPTIPLINITNKQVSFYVIT